LLNSDTKRHIDSARDVLVGVAPNPTTQIDQITYALIYKFMDDMDQASVKAGGEASFFVGDIEKYAWSNLMSTRMGNQEKMDLYSEALANFSEAKQLPELFRTIFKAAFLPYRSPETLGLFLKEISYFDYTHPEELGNAYEYLLSIMSSQGDAGQFRTPRHIIDFIVEVINPTKDDKVLDPACGTGGFLVSTYNHILEQHDGKDDPKKKEKPLTPDERKKLMSNLQGYDIDPTMVRIAQVNMYLHQFKNPQIFQYDSLTSEERWNEKYDVILANPPFMSPKGGIKPHNRFGVSSNRAEVLFVDYIMSHLKPKGRAGIVVPEGVIFQNGKAYKELRKNLIENGLIAVVSLPSGVFQPYSGVKTSILLVDHELAKNVTEIAFVKISADGFSLGASKREVAENDLPRAVDSLNAWAKGQPVEKIYFKSISKTELAEDGNYNLSAERYFKPADNQSDWPFVSIKSLEDDGNIQLLRGASLSKGDLDPNGEYSCIHYGEIYTKYGRKIEHVISRTSQAGKVLSRMGDVLVPATTTADALGIAIASSLNINGVVLGGDINIIRTENKVILGDFLAYLISYPPLKITLARYAKGTNIIHLSNSDLRLLSFPLPPLEIQEQIVAELDGFVAIISGARQVVDNWKPAIDGESNFEFVELGKFCRIQNGYAFSSAEMGDYKEGFLPVIKIGNVGADGIINTKCKFHAHSKKLDNFLLAEGDIVIAMTGATVGKVATMPSGTYLLNQRVGKVEMLNNQVSLDYVRLALQSTKFYAYCQATATGGAQGNISAEEILRFKIPLAPLETQLALTLAVDEERKQISSLRKLIDAYEERMQVTISKLWEVSEGVN
jgi:type I restriction enzyme M protein